MKITVNGAPTEIANELSLASLLDQLNLNRQQVAVELNTQLVPREAHADCWLSAGDRIEIVTLVGGG